MQNKKPTKHKPRILFLHHTATAGGSTRSLYEIIKPIANDISGTIITPIGRSSEMFDCLKLNIIPTQGLSVFDNTQYSYYRGFRWFILIREVYLSVWTALSLINAKKQNEYDCIHCNDITLLFPAILAKIIIRKPLIIHVRSVQRKKDLSFRSSIIFYLVKKIATRVIAIDEAVARSIPENIPYVIIHNCLEKPEFVTKNNSDYFRVSMVGILNPSKGIFQLLRAANILINQHKYRNFKFFIYGENPRSISRYLNLILKLFKITSNTKDEILQFINNHNLSEYVFLKGYESDISKIFQNTDLLCFPSYLDAPGRPVFEAALYKTPSLVAMKNPTSDVIINNKTGVCINSPDPKLISEEIVKLAKKPGRCHELGTNAREHALRYFDSRHSASKLLELYKELNIKQHIS